MENSGFDGDFTFAITLVARLKRDRGAVADRVGIGIGADTGRGRGNWKSEGESSSKQDTSLGLVTGAERLRRGGGR